jgi:catalase
MNSEMTETRRDFALAAASAVACVMLPKPAVAEERMPATSPLPERLSDAFIELFGNHPGFREIHAKGIVCTGTFLPSRAAATVSRAAHFLSEVPATVRFSDFAGVPTIPSTDANASPHGIGIKLHTASGDTDLVGHSVNAFPAATGEDFLAFIKALAASPPPARHPTVIEQYLKTHPAAMTFVTSMPAPPQSYVTSTYHMINAFKFTNAAGQVSFGRYHVLPRAGLLALDPALVMSRSRDYLSEELEVRLAKAPASFDLALQIARPEDPTNDGTKLWPSDRRLVILGELKIDRVVVDSLAAQRTLLYDPTRLLDGIDLSDDELPIIRSATYAISFARRSRVAKPT